MQPRKSNLNKYLGSAKIKGLFKADKRTTRGDLRFLDDLQLIMDRDYNCVARLRDFADLLGCRRNAIRRKTRRLEKWDYLVTTSLEDYKIQYEFFIPYWSAEWRTSLKWDYGFKAEERFRLCLKKGLSVFMAPKRVERLCTRIVNARRKELRESVEQKKIVDDDYQSTRLLITTYLTWRAKANGSSGGLEIDRNNPLYLHFMRLRERLLDFRAGSRNPGFPVQQLFHDFFRMTSKVYEERGWRGPYINQLGSDYVWETFVLYLEANFIKGSYWIV